MQVLDPRRQGLVPMPGLKPLMAGSHGVLFNELLSLPAWMQRPNILDLCRKLPDQLNHMRTDRAAIHSHAKSRVSAMYFSQYSWKCPMSQASLQV